MIHAYSNLYLNDARRTLAGSLNAAVYTYGYSLPDYYNFFINSNISSKFENGNPFVVSGMSGIELALKVIELSTGKECLADPVYMDDRSPEYWVGWALAYYQWCYACSFKKLNEEVPIETIIKMYPKYHEMDISQFNDKLNSIRMSSRATTYLKLYREKIGYSQSELSELSGIPLRTLQQYEQRQKSINHARADYIINLSKVLNVSPEMLLEIQD